MGRNKNDGLGRLGGRKKGTPNKVTAERKARLSMFIEDNWEDFENAYKEVKDPEKKCQFFISLLPYYAPKLASVEYKDKTPPKTYRDELDELSGEKTRQ